MNDFLHFVTIGIMTLVGTPLIVTLLAWYFKESIKAFLLVDSHKSINQHKQILDTYTESMKHSLQREMVRVESYFKGKFTVYPLLYKKILRAQGAVAGLLGARFSTNQDRFTEEDIRFTLEKNNVVGGEAQHILDNFRENREEGLKLFNKIMREIEFQIASKFYTKAKNYLVLNELFMSAATAEEAYKILKRIWACWVDSNLFHQSNGHSHSLTGIMEDNKKNDALITKLKDLMRQEMEPEAPK